ncbi:MAG: thiamine-phosphate pyrophosphorylase [Campylobacterota bacterium]|nr:thiamine-phosphate pyrophosphorylase [Campylobacterota bacterium]
MSLKGLYLITDKKLSPYENIENYLIPALENGVKIVQFRDKESGEEELLRVSLKIKELCKKYNALFLINDFVDLAKEIDAGGVHIGKDDEECTLARRVLGKNKIIGVSCYGDVFRAKEFEHRGASYVAFGAFFASPTKPNAPTISINTLQSAKKLLKIPICAIGGITLENAPLLKNAGADMVAVISDILTAENIANRAKKYKEIFDGSL